MRKWYKLTFGFVIVLAIFWFAVKIACNNILEEDAKRELAWNVRSSPELSKRFIYLYEAVHPGTLKCSFWDYSLEKIISPNSSLQWLAKYVSYKIPKSFYSYSTGNSHIDLLLVSLYIEDTFSQQDCLKYILSQYDFLYEVSGVECAAEYCFSNSLDKLDDREMVGLILMTRNPVWYNPIGNPENYRKKLSEVMDKLNQGPY